MADRESRQKSGQEHSGADVGQSAAAAKSAQVTIMGRKITLVGESAEHLQEIADYINARFEQVHSDPAFARTPGSLQSVLLDINLADDALRAQKRVRELEEQARVREEDLENVRQALIAAQMKLELRQEKADRKDQQ